jgi:O-antigen/teichoic acid export membrane protein
VIAVEETTDATTVQTDAPAVQAPNVRLLARNFLLLSAGELVAKLLTFAAFVYLARVLGPERSGSLEFVLAIMVFFTLAVDLGLGTYGAREIAKDRTSAKELLRDLAMLRLLLAGASLLLLLLTAALLPESPDARMLLTLYGLSLFAYPALQQWFFQGHDEMHWVALASITRQGVFTGLLFCIFRPALPLAYIGLFECISVATVAVGCLFVVRYRFRSARPRTRLQWAALLNHLRQALPIGLSELAWATFWYFATVQLGLFVGGTELGWYGVSHRGVMALHTFVWLYFFNMLPSLARCMMLPAEQLPNLLRRSLRVTAWCGVFVALMLTLLAGELLTIVYGNDFSGAAMPFSVLIWMLPIALLSGHYRYTLIAYNLQRLEFGCTAAAALVATGVGLLLIPAYGAVGAASALLVANAVNLGLACYCVQRRVVRILFHAQIALPLAALTLAAGVFVLLMRLNTWSAASAAALVYLAIPVLFYRRPIRAYCRRGLQQFVLDRG